jgi:membrane-associated phospholipid phosphatase
VRRWNEIARALIARYYVNSSHSARILAALAVAQYDATVAARRLADRFARNATDPARLAAVGRGPVELLSYPSQEAAIARASADTLAYFFGPDRAFALQNEQAHVESRIWMGAAAPSDIEAGRTLGQAAAAAVIAWVREDGTANADEGRVSRQPDKWFSEQQILPGFGRVKPWVMRSGDQFRAPEPPAVASPEFAKALSEIRAFSDRLSGEQLATAQYWNLGVGGVSVPGMWDLFALELTAQAGYSEARTARTLALLNMAMMDACIASWESKFHYLVPRPSMRDAAIREPLGLPSHPSYTSGHSAFSGAAEAILAAVFPASADELHRLAEEASASRWYGGIHYRFDGDEGLAQGRRVAAWVLSERGAVDGVPPPADAPASAASTR